MTRELRITPVGMITVRGVRGISVPPRIAAPFPALDRVSVVYGKHGHVIFPELFVLIIAADHDNVRGGPRKRVPELRDRRMACAKLLLKNIFRKVVPDLGLCPTKNFLVVVSWVFLVLLLHEMPFFGWNLQLRRVRSPDS